MRFALKSSDWVLHQHQQDVAFNNVILHVVGKHDREVHTKSDHQLITLEIGALIDPSLMHRFQQLQQPGWIPCAKLDPANAPPLIWSIWKERLNIERLQTKVFWVNDNITATKANWEEIMYRQLFKSMGTNVNKDSFSILAERIDHRIFRKNQHDDVASNALVFGMAGMLEKNLKKISIRASGYFRFLQRN